jgi:hypothetical protein
MMPLYTFAALAAIYTLYGLQPVIPLTVSPLLNDQYLTQPTIIRTDTNITGTICVNPIADLILLDLVSPESSVDTFVARER